ncbi:MmyB family transcriptional regulator [Streptomyces asoensis]
MTGGWLRRRRGGRHPCAGGPAPTLARQVFLDPRARRFYRDWDRIAHDAVGSLRLQQHGRAAAGAPGSDDGGGSPA